MNSFNLGEVLVEYEKLLDLNKRLIATYKFEIEELIKQFPRKAQTMITEKYQEVLNGTWFGGNYEGLEIVAGLQRFSSDLSQTLIDYKSTNIFLRYLKLGLWLEAL